MNKSELTIIGVLVVCVVVVFCSIGVFIILVQKPNTENDAALVVAVVALDTPTAQPTWPPTWTPAHQGTPTWVIQPAGPAPALGTPRPVRSPTSPAPTRTRAPGPISDAWDKTSSALAQRFEMSMTLAGDIWTLPGASGPKIEFSFMNFSGEFQGRNSHFLMKGYAADMLIPSDKGIEMITLGDNVYLHGPVPLLGAPDAKWYVAKASALDSARPLSRPTSWVGEYGNANWAGFKKGAGETLDGKPCDTYLGDKPATLAWYESANPQDVPDEDILAAFDAADSKAWICNDSYIHQFSMSLTTHSKYDPKQKGTLQVLMHFFDINAGIQIAAPPNAIPLDLPQSTDGTF